MVSSLFTDHMPSLGEDVTVLAFDALLQHPSSHPVEQCYFVTPVLLLEAAASPSKVLDFIAGWGVLGP